jgi:hypothetical protein
MAGESRGHSPLTQTKSSPIHKPGLSPDLRSRASGFGGMRLGKRSHSPQIVGDIFTITGYLAWRISHFRCFSPKLPE